MKFKDFLNEDKIKQAISYNIENNKDLVECIFRRESTMFFKYFEYLKHNINELNLSDLDKELLNTDLGTLGIFEGKEVPLDLPFINEDDIKELNKPKRGGSKKFYVYVKNDKGNIVKVSFGDPDLSVKFNDDNARKSFVARHKCDTKKDRTTPGYWSCNLPKYAGALGLSDGGNFYW